jgi:pyruvyltransferase
LRFAKDGDTVWGSGFIREGDTVSGNPNILAVRGPITGAKVGCSIYGDPALLLPMIYQPSMAKRQHVGVCPHYVDEDLVTGRGFNVISMLGAEPTNAIDAICACEHILSSSLHGLIVANAYGIPATWIRLSNDLNGGDYKFRDYFASINVPDYPTIDLRSGVPEVLDYCVPKYSIDIDTTELWRVSPWKQ